MHNALQTGAVIFGFDVGCQPAVERGALPEGACVKLHKVIYKYVQDLKDYIHDADRQLELEQERLHHKHPHHDSK